MSVQQELLLKLAETMAVQVRKNIEPMKASGKTAASVTPRATDSTSEVWALENIGALEYGRKPTSSGASKGSPTLYEQIQEWIKVKGIANGMDEREQKSVAYLITRKIHREGWKTKLDKPISSVIENLDSDKLLDELTAYYGTVVESDILKEVKQLQ